MAPRKKSSAANPWPKRLKRIRAKHGLTQVAAAAQLGVSPSTWICWENDQRRPNTTAQRLISIIFPD